MTELGRRVLLGGGTAGLLLAAGCSSESRHHRTGSDRSSPSTRITAPLAGVDDVQGEPVEVVDPGSGDAAFLVRVDDEVVMLSAVCTHGGCTVAWHDAEAEFVCPCHHGRYDATGAVTAGPPPQALRRLPVEVHDGQVYAGSA